MPASTPSDGAALAPLDVLGCPLQGPTLVEASAGTGKTWSLCALVLRLLLEAGLDVSRILVVSFTNAATAELRERLRTRIAETLARVQRRGPAAPDPLADALLARLRSTHGLDDATIARRLDAALQGFDEAAVFTIHGFCQRALGDAPFSAGVPLALEAVADDGEWRRQAVQDFWRSQVAGGALPARLVQHLLDRGDTPERWERLLRRRLAKPTARLLWPPGADGPEPADAYDESALAAAFDAARRAWAAGRDEALATLADGRRRLNGNTYRAAAIAEATAAWDRLLGGDDPLAAVADAGRLPLLTAGEMARRANKGQTPPAHPFFDGADALLARRTALQQTLERGRLRLLQRLLAQAPQALRRLKREQRIVAFDDMLANLHERLDAAPGLAAALRARFPAALVDEFQDTDPLQWAIFRRIWGGGEAPLFLIGDPKQAIYRFRNADLHTYLRARGEAAWRWTLAENQRSTPALLQALNAVFGANPRLFMLPGLVHAEVSAGRKPRPPLEDRSGAPRAPLQLWRLPAAAEGAPWPKAAARQAAAAACAAEIARLVGAGQRGELTLGDGAAARPFAAGDVAVLVRTHAQGARMRRALAACGIGSVELSQASVFASADAEELARVLAAMLEPGREPLLRAALASVAQGLDAAAIDALDDAALAAAAARFAGYRDDWRRRGIGPMLRRWLAAEDVAARLLARADGERRLTDLRHLAELLHEAEATHPSPEALWRWLQQRRRDALAGERGDDATQLRLESDRHLVQIVTIHKAKGLEFPFVFCPFLFEGAARRSGRDEGVEYPDDEGRPVIDLRDVAGDAAVQARIGVETTAEDLRLLYVALTRAVHRCHVVVGAYTTHRGSLRECRRAPLHWLVADGTQPPAEFVEHGFAPDTGDADWPGLVDVAWQRLAACAPALGWAPLPAADGLPPAAAAPPAGRIAALAPPRRIAPAWWIGSYSGLVHGVRHDAAAADHDARAAGTADAPAPVALEPDDVLRFPRGAAAGDCVHAAFERADFADPAQWPQAVAAALRLHPPGLAAEAAAPMLGRLLRDVLATPMPTAFGPLVLGALAPRRRVAELEFSLPVARLDRGTLQRLLAAHAVPVPALAPFELEGWLRGFIDLVCVHEGRHWIVDWKSNHLGTRRADYEAPALAAAVAAHGYRLQALLYTVALHRQLRSRVPGYAYETHVGGALVLFVRGVRPHWPGAGVFEWRAPAALVEALSRALDAAEATA